MLYAKEVPVAGGDTLFGNLYLAYDALSDGMKAAIANAEPSISMTKKGPLFRHEG